MSYDHQSPSDRADMEWDTLAGCPLCGEEMDQPNIELYETQGLVGCNACAEELLEGP